VALKEKRELNSSDLHSDLAKRELASMYRCDLSLIISNYEMNLLKEQFTISDAILHYLPFIVEDVTESQKNSLPAFASRQHFISIGNFLHEPNWDALLYLKTEIWPLIRKQLPKAELHNYGAYPSQKVFELNNAKEGFLIKGRAENAQTVMQQARLCLAPLRFGAGIKGKLVDAMLAGTPSITTSLGAEAMQHDGTWGGAVKNTAQDFAEAAVHFYRSQSDWQQAQINGFKILEDNFTNPAQEKELIDRIIKIQSDLEGHRALNFTGAMLMHHTTLSSRYMALWIEEKNKKQELKDFNEDV
jgi:glycosyltransferase involved in cell wall biosynthesis